MALASFSYIATRQKRRWHNARPTIRHPYRRLASDIPILLLDFNRFVFSASLDAKAGTQWKLDTALNVAKLIGIVGFTFLVNATERQPNEEGSLNPCI